MTQSRYPHRSPDDEPVAGDPSSESDEKDTPSAAQAEEALDATQQAVDKLKQESESDATGVELPGFQAQRGKDRNFGIDLLSRVNLNVRIELGRTRMLVEDVLRLNEGSVVELDKLAGDPVDIYVNDRHVARGEVLVLNENFCVRVSEIFDGTTAERQSRRRGA